MRLIDIEPYERNNDCELHYNYYSADGTKQVQSINSKDIQTIDAVPEDYYNRRVKEMQITINKLEEMNAVQYETIKKLIGRRADEQ